MKPSVDPLTLAILRDGFASTAHGTQVLENYLAAIVEHGRYRRADGLDFVHHHTENCLRNNVTPMAAALVGKASWQRLAPTRNWGAYGSGFRDARRFPSSVHERMGPALYAYAFDGKDHAKLQAEYALWQAEWAVMIAKVKATTGKRKEREALLQEQAPPLLHRLYDLAMTLRAGEGHEDFTALESYFQEMGV